METVKDFIKELKRLSPKKQNLPIQVVCPNGMLAYPTIKMKFKDDVLFSPDSEVESIIISYE